MMKSALIFISLFLFSFGDLSALTYTKEDSIKVVKLLQKGAKQSKDVCLTLYYANQFKRTPYVAATLEVNKKEDLIVNLRQLDCTTLVENVLALSMTTKAGSTKFKDFCKNLETLRYHYGKLNGYTSRNHYFSQWIASNEHLGLVTEVKGEKGNGYAPFTATQTISLNYMSTHASSYPMLNTKEEVELIAKYEKEVSGKVVRYIPRSSLDKDKSVLGNAIHDGDVLAIVTKKKGLDVAHLGFASWDKDGKLHLLNASQIRHKVVNEPMTLYEYMGKHPTQLGVRVVRMR